MLIKITDFIIKFNMTEMKTQSYSTKLVMFRNKIIQILKKIICQLSF